MSDDDSNKAPEDGKPGVPQVIWSVIAAVFGVQSGKNRERDFRKGDPRDYIAVYVVLVIALVVGMVLVVGAVLEAAGQ